MPNKYLLAGLIGAMCFASAANATTAGWDGKNFQFNDYYGSHDRFFDGGYERGRFSFGSYDGGHGSMFNMTMGRSTGRDGGYHGSRESLFDTFERICRSFYFGNKWEQGQDHGWTSPGPDTPSEVPLPAAGWLLVAGLGGMAAFKRRTR